MVSGIVAAVLAAVKSAWVWVLPWAGPWLARLAPWARFVPGLRAVTRWARAGVYVAVLALGVWGGVRAHAWWQGDTLSQAEADRHTRAALDRVALDAARAAMRAREQALNEREARLAAREQQAADDQAALEDYLKTLGEDRAKSLADGRGVIRADDEWLRAWQRRKN